jgi:hypothetical protein
MFYKEKSGNPGTNSETGVPITIFAQKFAGSYFGANPITIKRIAKFLLQISMNNFSGSEKKVF